MSTKVLSLQGIKKKKVFWQAKVRGEEVESSNCYILLGTLTFT
jgi:hypothetical protein